MLKISQLHGFDVVPPEPFGVTLTDTRLAHSSIVDDNTFYTAMDAGNPDINRWLVTVFSFRADNPPGVVTIGGVVANVALQIGRTGPTPDVRSLIAFAHVPDGPTVDVVTNWTVFGIGGSVSLYRVTNPSDMEYDTFSGQALTNVSGPIDVAEGGALILGVCQNQSDSATLTGVTEDFEAQAANWRHVVGSASGLAAQSGRTVGVSGGSTERTLVAISISPKT